MPIWLRSFHISLINETHKKQNEEIEKAKRGQKSISNPVKGPNVNPSSIYNFKK